MLKPRRKHWSGPDTASRERELGLGPRFTACRARWYAEVLPEYTREVTLVGKAVVCRNPCEG